MAYLDHVGKTINAKVVFLGSAGTIGRAQELHRRLGLEKPLERLDLDEGPVALFQVPSPGVRGYGLCLHLFWFDATRADDRTLELVLRGAEGLILLPLPGAVNARARAHYPGHAVGELGEGDDTGAALKQMTHAILLELQHGVGEPKAPPTREPPPRFELGGFAFMITGVFNETQQTPGRFAARGPGGVMFEAVLARGGDLDAWLRAQTGDRTETTLASHRVVGARSGERETYATDVAGDRLQFTMTVPNGAASIDPMRRLVFSMVETAILHRTSRL